MSTTDLSETAPNTASSEFHLDVTRTWGNRSLPVNSPQWRALRAEVIARDNRTCASCGYMSPHPKGRGFKVDHKDGNASNNDLTNLRVHCPPCEAVHHCGFSGMHGLLQLGNSGIDQLEIIRKTHEIFEESHRIPLPPQVDPNVRKPDIDIIDMANKLMKTEWDKLPGEMKELRGFFTQNAVELFSVTMNPEMDEAQQKGKPSTDAQTLDRSSAEAKRILEIERTLPWIVYSPESHPKLADFLVSWAPSKTKLSDVAWISIHNPKRPEGGDETDVDGLCHAWEELCNTSQPSITDLDGLAERFNCQSGKWLVFKSTEEVDFLWSRIATATHAGTLGTSAKVAPRDESNTKHVICIFTKNYTDVADVKKVREGLRRLGVKGEIGYKPDVYTYCEIYRNNSWNIPPTRYRY